MRTNLEVSARYHSGSNEPPSRRVGGEPMAMREEIERIYREQYGALVAFATSRLGDRGRAEELAQESFMRALRQQPENPRAWLYTVIANMIRDEGRHRAVQRRSLELVREQSSRPVQAPDESVDHERRARRVRAALATLAERDREALLLKERGLSYDEIAARLELSRGSIGTTLSRARQRLVAAWHELGPTLGGER